MNINFFLLINNHKVNCDKVQIYNDIDSLEKSILKYISESDDSMNIQEIDIDKYIYADIFSDPVNRNVLFMNIFNTLNDKYHIIDDNTNIELSGIDDSLFMINNYLVIPNGKISLIKDFNIIYDKLDTIANIGYNDIKEQYDFSQLEEVRDKCLNDIKNSDNEREIIINTVILGTVYNIIDDYIEEHRMNIQDSLIQNVKDVREKYAFDDYKKIKNEFDILNTNLKKILTNKEERESLEILDCYYNGEEVSYNDLVDELLTHMLPQYLTQKDINDTLEDYYVINTNVVQISRDQGGKIHIRRLTEEEKSNNKESDKND